MLSHAHERTRGPLHSEGYRSLFLGSDELIPVSAADKNGQPIHRLSDASKSAPLLLLDYSDESGLGDILRAVHGLALVRLPVQHVFTAHLASVLRTMVLDNRGVAWLPATLVSEDIPSGRLAVAASEDWHQRDSLARQEIFLHRPAEFCSLGKWRARQHTQSLLRNHDKKATFRCILPAFWCIWYQFALRLKCLGSST